MAQAIEIKVKEAVLGNKEALNTVLNSIQDMVYNLALRMLWHPEDAKDATQEILIRIMTNLGKFSHQSSFNTWVYRLASNHCINYKNKHFRQKVTFEQHARELKANAPKTTTYTANEAEKRLMVEEAKVGCSNAMLQCLSAEHRLAYIVGEILEMSSKEGGEILEISPENFRKKLSRSRQSLHNYLHKNCGLVNAENSCRCNKRMESAVQKKHIDPENLLFVKNKKSTTLIATIDNIEQAVQLYRTNARYTAPPELLQKIRELLPKE